MINRGAWIEDIASQAAVGGHIFPQMAASEAALESGFGESKLAREANNLFGMKQHIHPIFGTLSLPTKEFLNDQWEVVDANWVEYPTIAACFADRMSTLERLKDVYPHYGMALAATDEYIYIEEVSKSWATDPERAKHVTDIYREYFAESNHDDVQEASAGGN